MLTHDGLFQLPLTKEQGAVTGLGKPLKLLTRPERDRIPIWIAALGPKSVEQAAEIADGWIPHLFHPEKAHLVWGEALAAGAKQRSADLGPLQVTAGGMVAIGEGPETKALLDFARPLFALYVGGMGAKGKNFYNDVARAYGYEQEAERDPGPLPLRQEEGGRGAGPDRLAGGRQPRRPGVVREGADRGVPRGRCHPPDRDPGQRRPGRDRGPGQGVGVLGMLRGVHHPARFRNLQRIRGLDPEQDFDEILGITARLEFPWDYTQGTGIAFLRDFGVPSIARVLDATREFEDHGVKRYDDTILIGEEATLDGIDSPRGHAAVRRLNRIHHHYDIPPDEYAYVLATTIVGPVRVDPAVRLAAAGPARAGRDHPGDHAVRRADGPQGPPHDVRRLPHAAASTTRPSGSRPDPANRRLAEASIRIARQLAPSRCGRWCAAPRSR